MLPAVVFVPEMLQRIAMDCLFNDAVRTYTGRMIDWWWIGKDSKETAWSKRGTVLEFAWNEQGKPRNTSVGIVLQKFEPNTFRTQV